MARVSGRGNVVVTSLRITENLRKTSRPKPAKGVYCRDRCPRCGTQARCKRLSDLKAWCGDCQKGFNR